MDFRGMKRKDLQTLCKKHGIPANLKNTEMATRLASVFEKETEEIVSEMKLSPEDSVEADGIKENQGVSRKDKKVTFSPESENEVFEFTRSVKKLQRKNVQQGGIRLRRSKQSVAKGITVAGSHKYESEKESSLWDATKVQKVPRRSKRIGSSGSTQEVAELIALEQFEDKDISKGLYRNIQDGFQFEKVGRQSLRLAVAAKIAKSSVECGTLLDAKRSKRLADTDTEEDELVKNNATEVSVDFEVQETGKRHRKNVQDDSEVEKVPRRSRRSVNDIDLQTNTQDQRKSIRLKASNANPSMGAGTLDGTESKEERTTKQLKGSAAVNTREGELVKNRTKEPLIDCETELCRGMKVEDVSKVEMVTRRSKRLWNNVNVPMDKRPLVIGNVRTVKCNDLEVEKAPKQSRQLEKSVSEFLVHGQVQKSDKQSKITSGTDHESTKLLRRSKRTADNMLGQAMSDSPNRCLVIDSARDGASKGNMNDEMQVRVRYTRNYSKSDSVKAAIVVEGNLDEKKTNEALDSLVKSSTRVTRKMSGIDIETASTQSNLMQEEAGGVNVEARGSSKKPKIMNQECIKDTPKVMIENSPSSSETKAAESATENVLDFTLEKLVDSPQRTSTQELNCELMEEEREEKQEQDRVLMAATKKDKEEASSLSEFLIERSEVSNPESELFLETNPPPSSVQLEVNPESELGVPTGHILVKDIVSTVIAKEDSKTKEEILISIPRSVLKENSFVANAVLENSAECWNEIHSSKDGEKGSLGKEIQSENRHGNFSEYNTENSSAEEQADICKVGRISCGHCVNRETLDEVKDDSLNKSERTISSERGCKLNALELSGSLSTDFASLSAKEENVSECLEEDEMKALSQPIPINKAASNALDESAVFTTPERNLMLMEQLSENGKIRAADTVTHHNDEAVESHAVVFTTHEHVSLLVDSGLDEVGKEEEHTTTDLPDEYDVPNTTERYLMLGGSRQNEARNKGESIVVKLHDESNIATSPRQSSVEDFKGDGIERNEENRNVELHCESGTCTTPDRHALLLENSGGNKAMEFYEESVVLTGLEERHELFGYSGQDKITEAEVKKDAQFYEEAGLSTGMHKDLPIADPELGEAGWIGINNAGKSGLRTSPERQLLNGDSELKNAVKTAKKAAVEFHDESAARNIPERHSFPEEAELEEAAKSEENKAVELQVDCDIFNGAEKQFLLETDEGMKGDNITAKSHDMSDVLTASESHSLMGDFEPAESENKYEESKDVELLAESNISTNLERHLLFGDSGLDGTRKIKDNTSATCKESFVFTSPERNQLIGNAEPHTAGKQKRKEVFFTRLESRLLLGESGQDRFGNSKSGSSQYQSHHASSLKVIMKDDSVVQESHVAAQDFRENTIADSSGSISSKVSYSHELNSGEETAGAKFIPKGSQATNIVGLEAIQGTSKKSTQNSPHVDSVNLFDFDSEGAETIMDAERNFYILALPAKSNCETTGKISSQLEVAETCSMVSEESSPSTNIQNQINDASEELAITGNNEADELIEAKATKNLDSSGGSSVSQKTCVLGGTEHENLSYNSELEFKTTYEENGHKFLKDEATGPIEKDISLTPDEFIVQNNRNEEASEEMIKRETTPSPEETLNESSENREYLNIGESGTLSEKQARREPMLIYRTQVKPKRQDMKENASNSKIVDNLNVTAPRTSKRQPLQDLRKN